MKAIPIATVLILFFLDLLLPHAVGFLALGAIPYVAVVLGAALFAGSAVALTVAAGSVLWIVLLGPAVASLGGVPAYVMELSAVSVSARYGALVLAVMGLLFLDRVRRMQHRLQDQATRLLELNETTELFRAEAHALKLIHHKTKNRLATERSSITILYEQIQRLQSFEQAEVLDATLTAIRLMTGATSCVVYRFHEQSLELERIAVWPSRHITRYPDTKPLASSIEGYVVRTGTPFSLRQLIDNPQLRELEENRSVICAPIIVHNQIWGVLTVGRIPFLYYNEHAERALQVTAAIVAPALDQALPLMTMEVLQDAGGKMVLYPYDTLLATLEDKLRTSRELDFHVVFLIVELQTPLEFDQQLELSRTVGEEVVASLGRGVAVFQYQQAHQLALVSASTRSEAAGYLLLRVTELVSDRAWTVEDETVLPQVLVGFGTTAQSGYEMGALVRQAETMLSVYRRTRE